MLGDLVQSDPAACRGTMSAEEDARWLCWVTRQFKTIAGEDREIDLQEFKTALRVKEPFFAERFFALFDSDGSGTITLKELQEALTLLVHGSPTDKLRFLFQVYDVDGSGSIDADELRTVLRSCLRESAISLPDERLDELTRALFESADRDGSGAITFDELRDELQRFPGVMENLTISAAHWLRPPDAHPHPRLHRPRLLTRSYWHNHRSQLLCLAVYAGLHLLLFVLAASAYWAHGASIMVAKGCGQCLNFDCSFIAVLMLRRGLTWLRATWLAQVLPLDQNVQFHQLMGYVVAGLSLVHTVAHVVNFAFRADAGTIQFWELLLTARSGVGWVQGTAPPTGVALLLLLLLMVTCSSACVRRSGHFEVFYWTHLSYLPMWLLLIVHGPNFWKWLLVPGTMFLLEKTVGLVVSRMSALCIEEVHLLPSKVTHLLIRRPPLFHYRPGDYVYLNIPTIARYEWHPFTISSAPEQRDTIGLHIRSQGQWTTRLYESFKALDLRGCGSKQLSSSLRMRSQKRPQASEMSSENSRFCNIKCYVDGPYGTPTRRIFAAEHAVLIGAGIGVTPFASILQSLVCRHQKRKRVCPSCQHTWMDSRQDEDMKLRKVDFIWVNRDQRAFEWFVSLLTRLEMDQAEEAQEGRFLELHMYMTSALGKNDMKAIGLQMALDLLARKEKKDCITGLQTRTQPGRPDWSQNPKPEPFQGPVCHEACWR
ncbi:NADPH oxidase 5 [Carlito syrichta]|uniref:NADPH oxidase 5 n=1 Tax=Carlito syrichta TaxID=1868482 RepID=A0A3Q0DUP9_CARSF|nr:NADPH oxidase 5 [Carlito syrichta]